MITAVKIIDKDCRENENTPFKLLTIEMPPIKRSINAITIGMANDHITVMRKFYFLSLF